MTKYFNNFRDELKLLLTPQKLILFVALFVLLAFRTPQDLFMPYLWAEDGLVLIQGSIFDGLQGILNPGNGTYWFIQKILVLFCYWLVAPFGSIAALPYIMQILSKTLSVLSVMYFMSDKFEWIVKGRLWRFGICVAIILLMQQNSSDVLTCDTSLPFTLFFAAFLIGLNLLCGKEAATPNVRQTIFLALLALSAASAPFIAAIAGLAALRWLIVNAKTKALTRRVFITEVTKLIVVFAAVFIQMKLLLSSGRASADLDLVHRVVLNTKSFIFLPYWQIFHPSLAFFVGAVGWIVVWYLTKIPWKVVLYCGSFSWLFMFYCSMTTTADAFYSGEMSGRYVFTCFEISTLMLGLAVTRFLKSKKVTKYLGYIAVYGMAIVSLTTYNVQTIGAEFADIYKKYNGFFEVGGQDYVRIPIGPWNPWTLTIPGDISSNTFAEGLEFGFEYINGILAGSESWGQIDRNLNVGGNSNISGWAKVSDNRIIKHFFLKNGSTYTAGVLSTREWFHEIQLTHFGFSLNVTSDHFSEGMTTLEFIAETEDGQWHRGTIDIATTFIN